MPDLYRTLVRPVVTEKSSDALGTRREYTFEVHPDATKPQIRAAVEELEQLLCDDLVARAREVPDVVFAEAIEQEHFVGTMAGQ